jgi:putative membrane protein
MKKLKLICVYLIAVMVMVACDNRKDEKGSDKGDNYGVNDEDDAKDEAGDAGDDQKDAAEEANEEKLESARAERNANFVVESGLGNQYEIEAARLALMKGKHAKVKEYANMMVSDHNTAGDELKSLAGRKNITMTNTLTSKYQDKLQKLTDAKAGEEFDKEYMSQMVSSHKTMIDDFEDIAEGDKNDSELQAWTTKMLPKLKSHHEMAQRTEEAVKDSYNNKK